MKIFEHFIFFIYFSRIPIKSLVCLTLWQFFKFLGGSNVRKVMEETGCHIHFPDSNRNSNNNNDKSNQVSSNSLVLISIKMCGMLLRVYKQFIIYKSYNTKT